MQFIIAHRLRAYVARGLAFVTWFTTMQPASAFSPTDFLPAKQQPEVAADTSVDTSVLAYADESPSHYRHHRHWRHVRRHRQHQPSDTKAAEALNSTSAATSTTAASSTNSASSTVSSTTSDATNPTVSAPPQSTLQLVVTTETGGDPFEHLMTGYYWKYLNHAIPRELIFEPAQRSEPAQSVEDTPDHHVAASMVEKSVSQSPVFRRAEY
jgi:hypothetical protein